MVYMRVFDDEDMAVATMTCEKSLVHDVQSFTF